ncbi:FHA domain-containing protein [Chloroflexota bacterium]
MSSAENLAYLVDPSGKQHKLSGPSANIGRAVESDVVIASKRVSREHARIRKEGHYWLLEDLASTNGTYLNEERISAPQRLRDGDRVTVGEVTFSFHDPDMTTRDNPYPELEVNIDAGVVRLDRQAISLSPKEFALLVHLYDRRGKVCSKDAIGAAVWAEYQEGVYDYQIENLVRRLRTKIENDPAEPLLLITVRGLGYKLAEA